MEVLRLRVVLTVVLLLAAGAQLIRAAQVLLGSLLVVGLGILIVLLLPRRAGRVMVALEAGPLQCVGVGAIVGAAGLLAALVLAVTCLGLPLAALAALGLALAVAFGWVAAGLALGDRALWVLGLRKRPFLAAAVLGLALLTALASLPYLRFVAVPLAAAWGLGGVAVTRLGAVSYLATPAQVGSGTVPREPADETDKRGM